jgi:hypothetical protein
VICFAFMSLSTAVILKPSEFVENAISFELMTLISHAFQTIRVSFDMMSGFIIEMPFPVWCSPEACAAILWKTAAAAPKVGCRLTCNFLSKQTFCVDIY